MVKILLTIFLAGLVAKHIKNIWFAIPLAFIAGVVSDMVVWIILSFTFQDNFEALSYSMIAGLVWQPVIAIIAFIIFRIIFRKTKSKARVERGEEAETREADRRAHEERDRSQRAEQDIMQRETANATQHNQQHNQANQASQARFKPTEKEISNFVAKTVFIGTAFMFVAAMLISMKKNEAPAPAPVSAYEAPAPVPAFGDEGLPTDFKKYVNGRFGYEISYPETILLPQGESDNGDGQLFMTKEGDAGMTVYGRNSALNETLESNFQMEIKEKTKESPDKRVTYKRLKGNSYVVSGYYEEKIFYQKTMYIRDVDTFLSFYIEYPKTKKNNYDPVVSKISKSFQFKELLKNK